MPACFGAQPGKRNELCAYAMTACAPLGQKGTRLYLYTRPINAAGQPIGPWQLTAEVCSGQAGVPTQPIVTPELVQAAFEHLPFTPPRASIQPVGGRTLVNLPTYYQATFPTTRIGGRASIGPAAHVRVNILGHTVEIVPKAVSYQYDYGDGTRSGATTDAGGAWPSGGIQHTYTGTGQLHVRISTTYGGTYSIDGGGSIPLAGTVTIAGARFPLTVLSATNRLYADP